MPALFCLRLACGLVGALLLLNPAQVNPRFYRVHFLTALGLVAAALVFPPAAAGPAWWTALGASGVLCFLGSFVWSLDRAPGGRTVMSACLIALIAALGLASRAAMPERELRPLLV